MLCDFGLARGLLAPTLRKLFTVQQDQAARLAEAESSVALTEYVVTRWYRAPELLAESQDYDFSIDVWSIGCILAELYKRRPVFQGRSHLHQLQLILQHIGTPSQEDLSFISSSAAVNAIHRLPKFKPINFDTWFKGADPNLIDLLRRTFVFDPRKRITLQGMLNHPYLDSFRTEREKPQTASCGWFDSSFESAHGSGLIPKKNLQQLFFDDYLKFHPEDSLALITTFSKRRKACSPFVENKDPNTTGKLCEQ